MSRLLSLSIFVLSLVGFGISTTSATDFEPEGAATNEEALAPARTKEHLAYFRAQNLPYMKPLGCHRRARCTLSQDFNNDGAVDFVGLFEYSGPIVRAEDSYLDLVFVYPDLKTGQMKQQIFTYSGSLNKNNLPKVRLEVQPKGTMKLPIGKFELKSLGVNVVRKATPTSLFTPTFYWNGEEFAPISKEVD